MRKIPKGKLILIGGAEDKENGNKPEIAERNKKFEHLEILKSLLPENKSKCKIEVITTATSLPEEVGNDYKRVFKKIGFKDIGIMNITTREESHEKKYVERVKRADVILFSGGDQFKVSTILGCSEVVSEITRKYKEDSGFTVAGTSAGAMAMPKTMLYEGNVNEAMLKGDVKTSAGLGLLDNCIVDTHFIKRGRFPRLTQSILINPACVGIGLGEDTALVVTKGNEMECKGSGMVVIIDGYDVKHTNIAYAEENTPVSVENLRVHILIKGSGYKLIEREFIPEKT